MKLNTYETHTGSKIDLTEEQAKDRENRTGRKLIFLKEGSDAPASVKQAQNDEPAPDRAKAKEEVNKK